ncbi:excinuclease ABC subunit UvrC [Catenisphaera adipataccumulans]|jgi:excinuclease ABC subunit C|uniref:UvrABC system protein C n=1 Tax=Catenisphaera adipataccumulans TaxID=700500 RepID=A0A7W8FVW5_9FIRM|nr:excinuclease ABC subunit UvrC [Catenisphaera adipataccumulans]MBB5183608.1 excinuclease ABC subunit C [Catenisphaera adipataccumulans]
MISKKLQDKLALLPDQPGCYIMKDEDGNILYVGKAKVLKNRVRSYFHGAHDQKTTRLVSHIRDFEFIVTDSEKESLLLEINLIKKHHPPYNIMLMDDKSYPYIVMTDEDDFAVYTTRNVRNKKYEYFGPYPSAYSAQEMVKLINTLYPIRKCRHIPKQPCLYYHMHQCQAPCIHETDPAVNAKYRKEIRRFLKGDAGSILKDLNQKMQAASDQLLFEKAQDYHQMIQSVEHVMEKQIIDFKDRQSRDVFGYYEDKGYISFQGFFIRDGKLLERTLTVAPIYEDTMDAFVSFILQYYENNIVPKEILVPAGTPAEMLAAALNTYVHIPQRGEKKTLVDLVTKNAKTAHEQKFALAFRKQRELTHANSKLSEIFHKPIHTVEIFDNSHIAGAFNVSGLVVFTDGKPDKSKYRRYKLDGYRSDLDSMKEVIYRRYFRLLKEKKPMPDLLLVDGGAQQIMAAKEIKEMLDLDLTIAGLVKDDKHTTRALMNEQLNEVPLDKESDLFFLLTRMQDEVHRYAVSYHRQLRSKSMTKSILDTVSGIGPARKDALMKRFKSMKRMRQATETELAEVVPAETAHNLYVRLHENEQ